MTGPQSDLFDRPGWGSSSDLLDRRFAVFDRENPEVWRLFERFAFSVIRAGFKHYSARAIAHRIRWNTTVETKDFDFKLNNSYVRRYAMKFMREHPEHDGFFHTREPSGTR